MAPTTISQSQLESLRRLREVLGESTYQRIQSEVWYQFSPRTIPITAEGWLAPLALFYVCDDLILALREEAKRLSREQESAIRMKRVSGPLWELLKSGTTWSATLHFHKEHHGWEVVITRNGQRAQVQQFLTREKAETWADKKCIEITMGWKL